MGIKIKNNIRSLIDKTKEIDGWLSNQEGYFLYRLANSLPPGAVTVEIGAWKGKSAIWLGEGARKIQGAKIFSIDPHREGNYSEFKTNIQKAGLKDVIESVRETSESANQDFKRNIDLLFIDGNHEYAETKKDFEMWVPKLNRGAWVVFHDATVLPGPWKVSRNKLLFSSRFSRTGMIGSMVYGQFADPSALAPKIHNVCRNLLICLFASTYARMRKIGFPSAWRNKIRRLNFKWRISHLKNV